MEGDLSGLTAIQAGEAHHRDCLREAQRPGFRVLVLLHDDTVIGFAWLVFRRPAYWSDAGDPQRLPAIVNLNVAQPHRGRGYGSAFVHAMEQEAASAGHRQLYITVQPRDNPRAFALYQRLGYRPLQGEPYLKAWRFTDSGGVLHHGEDWIVEMVKSL